VSSRPHIQKIAAAAFVFVALIRPSVSCAVDEEPRHPRPPAAAVEGVPEIPDAPEVPGPDDLGLPGFVDLPALTDDSIYAKEITIDPAGGINIIDREGRRYYIPPLESARPPMPYVHPSITKDPYRGKDELVSLGSDIFIGPNQHVAGDVICIFCDVLVEGTVGQSVVAIFGHVTVNGTVAQDVVAPMGVVTVGPNAYVHQTVVASRIDREPGGRIGEPSPVQFEFAGYSLDQLWTKETLSALTALTVLFMLFLVLLAHVFASKNIGKVRVKVQASFFKSLLIGITAQILFVPVALLLLVTIIGIPVALFVLPLMVIAAFVLAYAAIGLWLGELIDFNTGLRLSSQMGRTMAGQLLLWSTTILSVLLWLSEQGNDASVVSISALGLATFSLLLAYVVLTVGSGAVLLTRYGTRPRDPQPVVAESPAPDRDATAPSLSSHPVPLPDSHRQGGPDLGPGFSGPSV